MYSRVQFGNVVGVQYIFIKIFRAQMVYTDFTDGINFVHGCSLS
jgi:hypothetical protein